MLKFKLSPAIYSICLLILLWQGLAMIIDYPELFPSVTSLLAELISLFTTLDFYMALSQTIFRGLIGFTIALALAVTFSAIALHHDFWKSFFHPLLVTTRSIPVISIVLIALLWFSPPFLPAFIAFFTMFPILYQNILSGLENTDVRLLEMAQVYRKSGLQRFLYIHLPAARKLILAGMATAMGFGWRAVIIGEVLASPLHGIGTGMKRAQAFIDMRALLAWTVVAILVSFVFDWIFRKMANHQPKMKKLTYRFRNQENILSVDLKSFELLNLNKQFNNKIVLNNISAILTNEQIHLLKSASGTGKTSLMKLIAGIIKKDSGTLVLDSNYVIAYSFQDIRLIPWLSMEANIAFALPDYPRIRKQTGEKINTLLDLLELHDQKGKLPHELSGGEQQRVALARALILRAHILLLDEPLTGLGQEMKIRTIQIIEQWTSDYQPIIIWATHEDVEILLTKPSRILSL